MNRNKNTYRIVRFYDYGMGEVDVPVPAVGDAVFLACIQAPGEPDHTDARPDMFETNSSHQPRLHGWCGSFNDVATYAEGAGVVTAVLGERAGVDTRWGHEDAYGTPYVSLRVRVLSDDAAIALRDSL